MGNHQSGEICSEFHQTNKNEITETKNDLHMGAWDNTGSNRVVQKSQSFVKPGFRLKQGPQASLMKTRTHSLQTETRQWSSNNQLDGEKSNYVGAPEHTEVLSSSSQSLNSYPVKRSDNIETERIKGDFGSKQTDHTKSHSQPLKTAPEKRNRLEQPSFHEQITRLGARTLVTVPPGKPAELIKTPSLNDLMRAATNATGDTDLDSEIKSCLLSITSMGKELNVKGPLRTSNVEISKHDLFRALRHYISCFSHRREHRFQNPCTDDIQMEDGVFNESSTSAATLIITSDELKAQGDHVEHNTDHSNPNITPESVTNSSDCLYCPEGLDQSLCNTESMENLKLFIKSMQLEQKDLQHNHQALKIECDGIKKEVSELQAKLNADRSIGLQLEAANGRFITGSLKHKFLQAEKNQLKLELNRRKLVLDVKEKERQELNLKYDQLQRLKTYSQRQCQEALMESNLTMQQLREISDKCSAMEIYKDEGNHLRNMMYNLQEVMGRIRVIISLKSTPHESCLEYISSSELAFIASNKQNNSEFTKTNSIKEQDSFPVLCQVSHVVCPGTCTALEVYNDVSTTIDGVLAGLNALFVAAGPTQSGKTTSMFGELGTRFSHSELSNNHHCSLKNWSTTFKERKASLKHTAKSNNSQFMDLSHSKEFASCFGLMGLCLVHLIQNISIKSIIELQPDHLVSRPEHRISVSVIMVPLNDHIPETDLVTNKIAQPTRSTSNQSGDAEPLMSFHLKQKSVISISEVILLCELIQNRLRAARVNNVNHSKRVLSHTVVIVRVERPGKLTKDSKLPRRGFLILVDTVGLDGNVINQDNGVNTDEIQQAIHAWKDMKALAQIMRNNPNPVFFERNRLLRTLQPLIFGSRQLSEIACTLLLHLPCDKSQSYTTMQCLRLGLWVMNLNRNRIENKKIATDEKQSAEDEKPRRQCVWRIGVIGQHLTSSRDHNAVLSTRFTPSPSSTSARSRRCVTSHCSQQRQLSSSSFNSMDIWDRGKQSTRHFSPSQSRRNRSLTNQ